MRDRAKRSSCFDISELRKDWKKDAISPGCRNEPIEGCRFNESRQEVSNLRESAGEIAETLDGTPIQKGKRLYRSYGEYGRKAEGVQLLSRWRGRL